ncbi:MAG: preprotein translocase subunit SecE [Desulfobacteraceae bacterium]
MKKPAKKGRKKKTTKKKSAAPSKNTQSTRVEPEAAPQPKAKQTTEAPAARTVQKKAPETKAKAPGSMSRAVKRTGLFLREAKTELRKVKWPTRKELLASTAVVLVLTLFVALFLGLVDFGLIKIIKTIVN